MSNAIIGHGDSKLHEGAPTPIEAIFGAIYDSPLVDEWWATDKQDEYVFVVNGRTAVRVALTTTTVPDVTPSEVLEGKAPHPFGYSACFHGLRSDDEREAAQTHLQFCPRIQVRS